jgi:6-phosphogluconolactonase/glucosamine-6-phosphate isomerase/deaminase
MKIQSLADPEAVAREGARIIAAEARASVAARGRFITAVSGGHTPWVMLRALADEDVPWKNLHLVQVMATHRSQRAGFAGIRLLYWPTAQRLEK